MLGNAMSQFVPKQEQQRRLRAVSRAQMMALGWCVRISNAAAAPAGRPRPPWQLPAGSYGGGGEHDAAMAGASEEASGRHDLDVPAVLACPQACAVQRLLQLPSRLHCLLPDGRWQRMRPGHAASAPLYCQSPGLRYWEPGVAPLRDGKVGGNVLRSNLVAAAEQPAGCSAQQETILATEVVDEPAKQLAALYPSFKLHTSEMKC